MNFAVKLKADLLILTKYESFNHICLLYKLPPQNEISDCCVFTAMLCQGLVRGDRCELEFKTSRGYIPEISRNSCCLSSSENPGRSEWNHIPTGRWTLVRGEFTEAKERFQTSGDETVSAGYWMVPGDTRGNMLYGGTIISYLLGSDFLCLTVGNPLYYRTSINKRKRKELSINTMKWNEAVHECQHQNLAMPAVQTVQYEFRHTPSLLDMTVQISQTDHCAPQTSALMQQPERESNEIVWR